LGLVNMMSRVACKPDIAVFARCVCQLCTSVRRGQTTHTSLCDVRLSVSVRGAGVQCM
jgi:hypothetical protein